MTPPPVGLPPNLRIRVTRDAPVPGAILGTVDLDLPDDDAGVR